MPSMSELVFMIVVFSAAVAPNGASAASAFLRYEEKLIELGEGYSDESAVFPLWDNRDGTLLDRRTGLIWKQKPLCISGNCSAADAEAKASRLSFAGHSDWRVPSLRRIAFLLYDDVYPSDPYTREYGFCTQYTFWASSRAAEFDLSGSENFFTSSTRIDQVKNDRRWVVLPGNNNSVGPFRRVEHRIGGPGGRSLGTTVADVDLSGYEQSRDAEDPMAVALLVQDGRSPRLSKREIKKKRDAKLGKRGRKV